MNRLSKTLDHPSDCIQSFTQLSNQLQDIVNQEDLEIVLLHLSRQNKIQIKASAKLDDRVIKFKSPSTPLLPIDKKDEGIALLKFTFQKVENQVSQMSDKLQE
jgi:hypothetical protein